MQFKLSAPGNDGKFFCVCVVSKEKNNSQKCCDLNVPDIKALYKKLKIIPTKSGCCAESTLFVISSKKPLSFRHFEVMVQDIVKNKLKATFLGAKKDGGFAFAPSSVCGFANEILHAPDCLKNYLRGLCVLIKDTCVKETVRQKLKELEQKYQLKVIFRKKSCKVKPVNKAVCPQRQDTFETIWSEWRDCGETSVGKWGQSTQKSSNSQDSFEFIDTGHSKKCKSNCFEECGNEDWVEESWTLPTKKRRCDSEPSCSQKNSDDLNWDEGCDWNQGCHNEKKCDEGCDWDEGFNDERKCKNTPKHTPKCHLKTWDNCDEGCDEDEDQCDDDWSGHDFGDSSDWDDCGKHKKGNSSHSFFNWLVS